MNGVKNLRAEMKFEQLRRRQAEDDAAALRKVSLDSLKSELARRNLVCKHCYDLDLIEEEK